MFTYNSLVKGYCKAGDLEGASKMLKMMIIRGFLPSTATCNYFSRYFSKLRKVEDAMNLYRKMLDYLLWWNASRKMLEDYKKFSE